MATDRQNQHLGELRTNINAIADLDPESLVQKERLGSELSFEAVLPISIEIIKTAKTLQKVNLEEVPYSILAAINAAFVQIVSIFNQIKSISPQNSNNIPAQRVAYLQQLEDHWGSIYLHISTIIAAQQTEISRGEVDALSNQVRTSAQFASEVTESLRNKQSELSAELEKFLTQKTEEFQLEGAQKLAQVEEALTSVRSAAAEAGVSQNSVHFQREAIDHQTTSKRWLTAVVILSILLVFFSLWGTKLLDLVGLQDPGSSSDLILQIRFYLQKTIILFVLIFVLILATKNYNSARHNYVVNKHRSNSLSSFTTFVASASDEQTKNAVLLQATQSIFSHQPSGYIKIDGENSSHGTVIEVLRSIGSVNKDK